MTTIDRSPRTHWNVGKGRSERRVLQNGRWVRPESVELRRTIFGHIERPTVSDVERVRTILGAK